MLQTNVSVAPTSTIFGSEISGIVLFRKDARNHGSDTAFSRKDISRQSTKFLQGRDESVYINTPTQRTLFPANPQWAPPTGKIVNADTINFRLLLTSEAIGDCFWLSVLVTQSGDMSTDRLCFPVRCSIE